MASFPWLNIVSGTLFGSALTAAGMYSPSTIIGQMHLTNFHMLKGFLAASASSSLAIIYAHKLHLSTCKPRTPNTLSLFGTYDGNLIGGLLLGFGMTLSGACPGTVFPQFATGISSSIPTMGGAILGGILYSFLKPHITGKVTNQAALTKPTLYQKLGTSEKVGISTFELLCSAGLFAATVLYPKNSISLVNPIVGGLLIGGTQFASLYLLGCTLGISTAFEQIGDFFWWAIHSLIGSRKSMPTVRGTAFAFGTLGGSYLLSKAVMLPIPGEHIEISAGRAVLGGVCLVVGSRVAGGCTSGHGISGMSMLSTASIISVAGMFGGGIALAHFFS
ncbi:YeeE/YedE family protein [Halenospora varia]|nr:YeeE/YedE family protein [Halenospora varia]